MGVMLVLLWLLILMMKMMKSDAAEVIPARSGEAVLLTSDLRGLQRGLEPGWDVRWTHLHLVVSLRNNVTACHHGRCRLQSDGSLRFSRVQPDDSGHYSLEVFDQDGKRVRRRDFLLRVEAEIGSSSVTVSVLTCCFLLLLLLLFIIFIILRRRRSQSPRAAGPLEENAYVVMHGNHGNKRREEEEKQESVYVPCHRVVSMETPITEQTSAAVEDIYV